MAILRDLRTQLAREVSRLVSGTATGGSTTTIIDTAGLNRYTETDALKGGIAYIRTTSNGLTPQGEWRWITAFNPTTDTLTVDRAYGAAVETGDTYELYLAPLELEQWNTAVARAVVDAWPEVWDKQSEDITPTGADNYTLNVLAADVLQVVLIPVGTLAGRQGKIMPRNLWAVSGLQGTLKLHLYHPIRSTSDLKIRVWERQRFVEPTAEASATTLDLGYLMAAAKANWYGTMADAARVQADSSSFLQLMNHWQQIAAQRKVELRAMLEGLQPVPERGRR